MINFYQELSTLSQVKKIVKKGSVDHQDLPGIRDQLLQTLQDRVRNQLSRGKFVSTKNLLICAKFKINLN